MIVVINDDWCRRYDETPEQANDTWGWFALEDDDIEGGRGGYAHDGGGYDGGACNVDGFKRHRRPPLPHRGRWILAFVVSLVLMYIV
jgi:hypothetical protein